MQALKTRPSTYTGPLVAALCALLTAPAAHAQVFDYAAFKNAVYQQTGSAPPTASGYFFGGQITVNDPSDADSATLTLPDGTVQNFDPLPPSGLTFFDTSNTFATKVGLDTNYPNGTYTFAIAGGGYGPDSGTLTISGDMYPSAVPTFTPGTVAALASYDPSSDFTFNFNSFNPDTTDGATFFSIYDPATGMTVPNTETSFDPSNTSITVPGGTLMSGHAYQVNLDFSNRHDTSGAGFLKNNPGGATAIVAFDDLTQLNFITAPEPSAWAGLALGALGLAGLGWKARRRTAANG